jgi:flagellar basal body-associated protein FliL
LNELVKLDVVVRGNLLESLPDKLMLEVNEKTKKKMMKEQLKGNVNPQPRTMSYQPVYQPAFLQKADCLCMELLNHVNCG